MDATRVRSQAVTVALTVAVAAVAALPLYVHATGFEDVSNHPGVVVPMAIAAVVLLLCARSVGPAGPRRLLVVAGGCMAGYLAVTALLAWYGGVLDRLDTFTQVLAAVQSLGWVPPITLMLATYLRTAVFFEATGPQVQRLITVMLWYTAVTFGAVLLLSDLPVDSPYLELGPLVDAPTLAAVVAVLPVPWMVMVFVVPVLAWRWVGQATGPVRERMVTVALASMVTPVTIVYCLAVTVLCFVAGVLSLTVGALTLSLAYFTPFVVAAPAVVRALDEPAPTLPSERTLSIALAVVVGLPTAIVVVTIGWLAADRAGPGGALFVVLAVLALGAAAAYVRRRLAGVVLRLVNPLSRDAAAIALARVQAEAARTAERRRLERDLHDGVQGRLLALALDLRLSQRRLDDGEANLVIADAVEGLGRAIDELRAVTHGDVPVVLERKGLRAALSDFTGRLPLDVTVLRAPERLPPSVESVAYLVVCEALTNCLKHARAASVEIDIGVVGDVAVVQVSDDGVGGADLRGGTGLRGLAERVSAVGGQLMVSDREPQGTLLEVALPCES